RKDVGNVTDAFRFDTVTPQLRMQGFSLKTVPKIAGNFHGSDRNPKDLIGIDLRSDQIHYTSLMQTLPKELLLDIFSYLNECEPCKVSLLSIATYSIQVALICKLFQEISSHSKLWQ